MAQPNYYNRGRIPVWDFIRDQELDFHKGNAIKYICRAGHKGSAKEDIEKAIHYLENELQHLTDTSERVQAVLSDSFWDDWTNGSILSDS
jgi:hypothetical protein